MDNKIKNIPSKNYIIITLIFIITFGMCFSIYSYFKIKKEEENNVPVIRGVIPEIEIKDLDDFILEHDDFLLYVGVANNSNCRNLEEDLIKFIKDKKITDIYYLNITNSVNKVNLYNDFNSKYANNIKLNNYPAFIIFRDKKIYDLVERKDNSLYIGDIQRILDEYGIIGG